MVAMVAKVRHHPDHPLYDKILKEDEFYLSLRHFVNEIKTPSIECKNSWFEWSYVKLSKINNSRHHSSKTPYNIKGCLSFWKKRDAVLGELGSDSQITMR